MSSRFFTGVNYLLSFLHCVFESRDGSMIVYARQTRRRTFEGSYLPCNMLKDLVIMLYQNLTTRKFSIVVQLYVPTPFIHITCVQLFQNYACRFVAQSLTRTHPYSLTFSLVWRSLPCSLESTSTRVDSFYLDWLRCWLSPFSPLSHWLTLRVALSCFCSRFIFRFLSMLSHQYDSIRISINCIYNVKKFLFFRKHNLIS